MALMTIELEDMYLKDDLLMTLAETDPNVHVVTFSSIKTGMDVCLSVIRPTRMAEFKATVDKIITDHDKRKETNKHICLKSLNLRGCNIDDNQLIVFAKATPYIEELTFVKKSVNWKI